LPAIGVQSKTGRLGVGFLLIVAPGAAFAQSSTPPSAASQASASGAAKASAVATVDGFTITATPSNSTSIDRKSYSVTSDVRAATGSLSDILQNLPAVDINPQSGVSLRGDTNVTILIDGKPAPQFQGANQAQALQSMPASQIDHIEVMTTPSAEFTSSGTAGVINIVTKKNLKLGPTMTLGASYGPQGRTQANVSASYNTGKLSIAADANYRQDPYPIDTQTTSLTTLATGASAASRFSNRDTGPYETGGAGVKVSYQLDPKTQIYAGYRTNIINVDLGGPESLATGASLAALGPDYTTRLDRKYRFEFNTLTAGFSHDFAGDNHQLTFDYRYGLMPRKDIQLTDLVSGPTGTAPNFQNITTSLPLDQNLIKAVYRRPMPHDGRLVLGTDWQINDLRINTFGLQGDDAQAATLNSLLTDRYHDEETQSSFYGTYQQPFGKDLVVLAGVRIENDALKVQSMGVQVGSQNYTQVNPSLNVTYNLDQDTKLTFGYSRRMNRPAGLQYNPALVYQSQTSYYQGNPYLKPSIGDSFEATVEHRHAGDTYTATAYDRQNTDVISTINAPLGNGVFVTQFANLAARHDVGFELAADGTIIKGLKYSFSGDLYHSQTSSGAGAGIDEAGWLDSAKANLNWSPTADDLFQVDASLGSRSFLPQGYWAPMGNLNLGYRRNLHGGLFLTLTADDVLGTFGEYTQILDAPGLNQRTTYKYSTRAVLVGLSYSFGGAPGHDKAAPKLDYSAPAAAIGQ
jgi:outer membrane receptor protein involved in Fe transport